MSKRKLVLALLSLFCMSLLFNGILFMEWDKAKQSSRALETEVAELTAAKQRLSQTVAELEGQIAYPEKEAEDSNWQHSIWWQTAQLQGDSEKAVILEKRIKENPIDAYFATLKEPETTVDFVAYYYLYQKAWQDEMRAVYQQLLGNISQPEAQQKLTDGQDQFAASLQANYDFLVAAFGAEGISPQYGTNVWLLSAGLAQQYKERTIELLEWSYLLNEDSNFTFSVTDFNRKYDASDLQEKQDTTQNNGQNNPNADNNTSNNNSDNSDNSDNDGNNDTGRRE